MAQFKIEYQGEKHCELTHLASGTKICTDAPKDNFGKGEAFSPTDLMSASLGACMLTIMGIQLESKGVNLKGSTCEIVKHMGINPRRIVKLEVHLKMSSGISDSVRPLISEIAKTCPVQMSLNPEIDVQLNITYPD